jgi:leader peptidase (prepilin peptidase)/N-methyltransferase
MLAESAIGRGNPSNPTAAEQPHPLRLPLGRSTQLAGAAAALALSIASLFHFGPGLNGWIAAFVCTVLVVLSLVDLDRRTLPNRILIPATVAVAVTLVIADPARLPSHLLAAGAGFAGFFLLAVLYPPGMGMGDVKLMLLLGLVLGHAVLYAAMLGAITASAVSITLLVRYGGAARQIAIPYGPFLAGGAITVLFLAHVSL